MYSYVYTIYTNTIYIYVHVVHCREIGRDPESSGGEEAVTARPGAPASVQSA